MAIDFSQVKTITIPEGSVKKITDSTGAVLWQGESGSWHTIWEGNKTCSLTKNGTNDPVISGENQNLVKTVAGTGYEPKIRITFNYSNTNTDYNNWNNEFTINTETQATISSPVTIEAVKSISAYFNSNMCLVLCVSLDRKAFLGVGLKNKRDKTNNSINISLVHHKSGDMAYDGNFTITFTVTKIEQYY